MKQISDEELNTLIENLEKKHFIHLSKWYGGKKAGVSGIILDLHTNKIYKYKSDSEFVNNDIISNNEIDNVGFLKDTVKEELLEYIENEPIFTFNNIDKIIFDSGTTIKIKYNTIDCIIKNADKTMSNNKFNYYDKIFEIINNNIVKDNYYSGNDNNLKFNKDSNLNLFSVLKDKSLQDLLLERKEKIDKCKEHVKKVSEDKVILWECKMIIENIRLIDSKIINTLFKELSEEQQNMFIREYEFLENYKCKSEEDIYYVLSEIDNL